MSILDKPTSSAGKHTVYVDIDDEITAIIEKVKASPDKIVALVLPKRATVLQSIINMKLLKKSATAAKKSLVLVTSEAGLMPLAGSVGLHVAKSLESKPEIPLLPNRDDSDESEISEAVDEEAPEIDKTKSVGALAAAAAKPDDDDLETIELDDEDVDEEEDGTPKKGKKKLSKVFKVPNFDRFRLSFFLVILVVILLIGAWFMAFVVMPKAAVVIDTDTSTQTSDINFTINTDTKDLNLDQAQVPAVQKEVKKTDTEKATATGKKDKGTKATGTVVLSIPCASVSGTPPTIPAGTGISSSGQTFITDSATDLTNPSFSPCKFYGSTTVTAQNAGTQYNLASGQSFSVAGYPAVSGSNSAAMTGGTTNVVTVVAQADIDGATAKMKGRQDAAAATELSQALLHDSLKGLDETKIISDPAITSTPAVGTETTADITVTSVTTYDILGVKADFLAQLIKKDISSKADASKEGILDDGLGAAVIHVVNRKSPTEAQMSLHAIVISGPKLDANAIKDQIRGKKRGDAENIIGSKAGVKDVTITYKPFWVLSTPKAAKKITVTIKKPDVKPETAKDTSNGYTP